MDEQGSGNRMWRSRWAAIGAAVAVSLGAGGIFFAEAASPPSSVVLVAPVRILDTRDPGECRAERPLHLRDRPGPPGDRTDRDHHRAGDRGADRSDRGDPQRHRGRTRRQRLPVGTTGERPRRTDHVESQLPGRRTRPERGVGRTPHHGTRRRAYRDRLRRLRSVRTHHRRPHRRRRLQRLDTGRRQRPGERTASSGDDAASPGRRAAEPGRGARGPGGNHRGHRRELTRRLQRRRCRPSSSRRPMSSSARSRSYRPPTAR